MKKLIYFLPIIVLFQNCGGFQSSFQQSSGSALDTQLFIQARTVLQQNCFQCHGGNGPGSSFNMESQEQFIAAGLIVAGSPNDSRLIHRIQNYDGEGTNNNMPLNGPPLSNGEFQTLYNWILSIPSGQSPFLCENPEFDPNQMDSKYAKRLSIKQYQQTLTDLLARALAPNIATQMVNSAISSSNLPNDNNEGFNRENNVFNGSHAQAFFDISENLASQLSGNRMNDFINGFIQIERGNCNTINLQNLSNACKSVLVENFGSRAFRRPLRVASDGLSTTDGEAIDERAELLAEMSSGTTSEQISALVFRVLLSPHFLFQLEDQNLIRSYQGSNNIFELSSYALINRLSYRYWNSMPDEELMVLAEANPYFDSTIYYEAVDHIMSRENSLDSSLREYYNEWLHLEETPNFSNTNRLSLIDNQINFDNNLRRDMINEIEELGSYVTRSGGSFEDLFNTDISFARSTDLMRVYDLTTPAPQNIDSQNAVRFPASQRSGILTRAALLNSGSEFANPILRGVHVARDYLCVNLGSPPSDAISVFEQIEVAHNVSTRDRYAQKTAPAACATCHQRINPLGFAFSGYNSFGKFIEQEPIFALQGNSIESYVPIDAEVDLSDAIAPGVTSANGVEISRIVASQTSTKACFAEKFAHYALSRNIDEVQDACSLDRLYNALGSSGNLNDMIRTTALEPEFRLRKLESD